MKYFIDTAVQQDINKWKKFVNGVTCNPTLLSKAGIDHNQFINTNMPLFNNVFVQINSKISAMNYMRDKVVFKVPLAVTSKFNGYELLADMTKMKHRTCSTIVYDLAQFDYACEVGAEFSIVLYARNENKNIIKECYDLKQKRGYETKIIAASFRKPEHIIECMKAGADYATVPPKILEGLFNNFKAVSDYIDFYRS